MRSKVALFRDAAALAAAAAAPARMAADDDSEDDYGDLPQVCACACVCSTQLLLAVWGLGLPCVVR
jgi:hypothetical protein